MLEVELKYPLPDTGPVVERLRESGARRGVSLQQRDFYWNHPARDFGQTDEAFRIRTEGDKNALTYKGPKIDTQTKTRREIEFDIAAGAETLAQMEEMLTALSFRPVRAVDKIRQPYYLARDGRDFEVVIDDVRELGTFVEIETQADDVQRDAACDAILLLAGELGLSQPERKSYLCLLLELQKSL